VGVFLSFYFFGYNFDLGGYASLVLLSGNVVCAAIFIIAEYNSIKNYSSVQTDFEIYLEAFDHKIAPILLTVFSTVVGLIPFLVFAEKEVFWFALGVGTISGLVTSLIAIIVIMPILLRIR
jgi:multidrug efflux pump subunit AcrB